MLLLPVEILRHLNLYDLYCVDGGQLNQHEPLLTQLSLSEHTKLICLFFKGKGKTKLDRYRIGAHSCSFQLPVD